MTRSRRSGRRGPKPDPDTTPITSSEPSSSPRRSHIASSTSHTGSGDPDLGAAAKRSRHLRMGGAHGGSKIPSLESVCTSELFAFRSTNPRRRTPIGAHRPTRPATTAGIYRGPRGTRGRIDSAELRHGDRGERDRTARQCRRPLSPVLAAILHNARDRAAPGPTPHGLVTTLTGYAVSGRRRGVAGIAVPSTGLPTGGVAPAPSTARDGEG